jgi:uncharacterized repeat protein (TIGR01451 family)
MRPPNRKRSVTRRAALVACATLLIAGAPAALAADPDADAADAPLASGSDRLETDIVAEKHQPADGRDSLVARFVPAKRLEAGDEVHYTIRVRNPNKSAVTGVQLTKRLPLGMHYVEGSAVGPACDLDYSADGGQTYSPTSGGGELTHLRWTLHRPLAPGATALLRFRATFR